jgi:VWFA-related protein
MRLPSKLGSLLIAFLAFGQDDPVFRSDTRLVVLHATVMDSRGRLVTNLPVTAFKVFENGQPQPLKLFRREDIPVSLGMIVDNSGSMRDKRKKVESAALAMVKASNPRDEVFIVNFNDTPYLDVDFTGDIKAMEEGVTRIDSRGGTAFYDALDLSIDHLKKKAKRDKRVLMLITDGNDTASQLDLEKLIQKLHNNPDVVVHAIGLLGGEEPREAKKAKRALQAITQATGGLCYFPEAAEDVEKLAVEVAHDIRNQYVLAYSPTVQQLDGTFRQIKVTANGPNKPAVRTRNGYYATPDAAGQRRPIGNSLVP